MSRRGRPWLRLGSSRATSSQSPLGRLGYRISLAAVPVVALLAFIGILIFQAVKSDDRSVEPGASAPASSVKVGYVDPERG